MRFSVSPQLCATAVVLLITAAAYGEWKPTPDPAVDINDGFGDSPHAGGGLPRYVAPGQAIGIPVRSVVDLDTNNCGEPEVDNQVEAEVYKADGTVAGNWTSESFSSSVMVIYPVPANAQVGQTLTLKLRGHDKRGLLDPRKDMWNTLHTWNFTVKEDCPTYLEVDNTTDTTGAVPPNETKGNAKVRLKAYGTPPEGRESWDGAVLTEELGNFQCSEDDLTQAAYEAIEGQHPNNGDDSSFTIGTGGVDMFEDDLGIWQDYIILKDGVNTTTITHVHPFKYGDEATYDFDADYDMTRQAGPRVKGDLGLSPCD